MYPQLIERYLPKQGWLLFTLLMVAMSLLLISKPASAADSVVARVASAVVAPSDNCRRETAQVSTQHNFRMDTAQNLLKNYDDEKKTIQDVAKKIGVTAQLKNENYNITSMNDYQSRDAGNMFNFDANTSYAVEPKEKAKDFFVALSSSKIRGRLNYSMYDNCNRN